MAEISRRRALRIMGAAAGMPLLSRHAFAAGQNSPVLWHGQALGAPTTLVINHPDRAHAQKLVGLVVSEVQRLEDILSLYRPHSALVELNRVGALATPPAELVAVLEAAGRAWDRTGGLFDPTVQAMWSLYARHFGADSPRPEGPSVAELEAAKALTGFGQVQVSEDRIVLARKGMALTLNGIAQGYVTDRVVDLLRDNGIESSLVDMGESRAIGAKGDGSPWRIGLAESQAAGASDTVIPVIDKAVATSSFSGFHFDAAGRFSHILDPRTGAVAPRYRRMTVIAPDATRADAYSTAFSLAGEEEIRSILKDMPEISVDFATL